jgi:hypothetical protein
MTKSPAAPLMIPGMPKKGEALPAVQSLQQAAPADPPAAPPSVPVPPTPAVEPPPARLGSRVQPTIAVTVRLGETRYERMKSWGTARRVTNQDVIVAALDRFFELNEQEREHALASVRK